MDPFENLLGEQGLPNAYAPYRKNLIFSDSKEKTHTSKLNLIKNN